MTLMCLSNIPKDIQKKLLNEHEIAYSESCEKFICSEQRLIGLQEKYQFVVNGENDDGDAPTAVSLYELLEDHVLPEEDITITSSFSDESLEHNMGNDTETITMLYEEDSDENQRKNLAELFEAKDWMKYLITEAKIIMLSLIGDSLRQDVDAQIQKLEHE